MRQKVCLVKTCLTKIECDETLLLSFEGNVVTAILLPFNTLLVIFEITFEFSYLKRVQGEFLDLKATEVSFFYEKVMP